MFQLYQRVMLLFAVLIMTIAIYPLSFFTDDLIATSTFGASILKIDNPPISISFPKDIGLFGDASVEKDVIYSVCFSSKQQNFLGYIQVWKIEDLDTFLNKARSQSKFKFIDFSKKETSIKTLKGFVLDWTALSKDKKLYSGKEFFLKGKGADKVLRASFFTNKGPFSSDQEKEIKEIITSIKWK